MKKYVWLSVLWGIVSCAQAEMILHVAVDARAGGDGSSRLPLRSLTEARDAIRRLRKTGSIERGEAVTVRVGPGVYRQLTSFELGAEDSGSARAPVIYQATQDGAARLQGGVSLAADSFHPVTDPAVLTRLDASAREKVRVCDVSPHVPAAFAELQTAFRGAPVAPWLYVNGKPMTLARWPNRNDADAGWASFSQAVDTGLPQPDAADPALRRPHPGAFRFEDPRPARWNLAAGVWLLGYWTHDWSDEVIRVASYDEQEKVLALAAPHSYGINAGTWGAAKRRFFAMNALEELDEPGEWYLDRPHKQLYFYPAEELAAAEIVLATSTQPLVKANGAKHLKLIGLDFQYHHADGIVAQATEHLEIIGCTIANLAGNGISIQGSANVVRSCDLFQLGRGGISLNGGDRQALTPARNLAENNHIHHFGLFQRTYAPGIAANGCGQIARHNSIHDAPHNAVLYGGNEHLFERNEVYRVVMETGDAGAFYSGRDWTSQGNVLRHNFIHDLGSGNTEHVNTMGIYLDDCDCGDTLEGNVFRRAGRAIMIGGGRDNAVLNNLVLDCPIGLHIDARGMTWKQWNNPADPSWCLEEKAKRLEYTQPPWSTRYPRLAAIMDEQPRQPLGNKILRNVFIGCSKQVCSFDGNVMKLLDRLEIADNLAVSASGAAPDNRFPGFTRLSGIAGTPVDFPAETPLTQAAGDRAQAWIQTKLPSFEVLPISEIGLYRDEYRPDPARDSAQ